MSATPNSCVFGLLMRLHLMSFAGHTRAVCCHADGDKIVRRHVTAEPGRKMEYATATSLRTWKWNMRRLMTPSSPTKLANEAILLASRADKYDQTELLEALDRAVANTGLRACSAYRIPSNPLVCDLMLGKTLFWHPSTKADLHVEYQRKALTEGTCAIARMTWQNRGPFTFAECARATKASGNDRWVFELMAKYGLRDGFSVPVGTGPQNGRWTPGLWLVSFWSPKAVRLTPMERGIIHFMAILVAHRLEKLVPPKLRRRDKPLSLSQREMTVLEDFAHGRDTKKIATHLNLSQASVRTFERRAIRKLKATSRTHAVYLATKATLLT